MSESEIFNLAKYIPNIVNTTKIICIKFKTSWNKNIARIVAVSGCIRSPIEPSEAGIFPIPCVIKYWPPSWHKIASENKFIHSNDDEGMKFPPWINIGTVENIQQKSVV